MDIKIDTDAVEKLIVAEFLENNAYEIGQAVKQAAIGLTKEVFEQKIAENVSVEALAVVKDMAANGWARTDSMGRQLNPMTLRECVINTLDHSTYSGNPKLMTNIISEVFRDAVKKEIEPLVKEAKVKLASLLDKAVQDAIAELTARKLLAK